MMRGFFIGFSIWLLCGTANADVLPLYDALRATYTACVGIDDELADLKTMAGINTAVTGVGTAAGVGATVTGFVKAEKDKQIKVTLSKLRELEQQNNLSISTASEYETWVVDFETLSTDNAILTQIQNAVNERNKLLTQSIKLGNWRTGLLAANTATNVAGAAIAGTNRVDADLQTQIDNCITAVTNLQNSIAQARIDGQDVTEAEQIATTCNEYKYVDITPINNRGRNSMISSIVGAATGLAGTVTSAVANTEKTRSGDEQREKNLNTASNVLSIGATTSSAVATVFNATQIAAIKKVADVASACTGVLR